MMNFTTTNVAWTMNNGNEFMLGTDVFSFFYYFIHNLLLWLITTIYIVKKARIQNTITKPFIEIKK